MPERRALSRAVKRTIMVIAILTMAASMGLLGWGIARVLGSFAPLVTIPVGYAAGSLTYLKTAAWLRSHPTKETVPSE